jgi:hypothetical protein
VNRVEVQDVEPADHRAIEEDGPDPLDPAGRAHERHHPGRAVATVDADPREPYRFHALRSRDDDRRDRSVPVASGERSVVDAHDPGMRLTERSPQR